MSYLIDTNICIYVMNQRPPQVIEKFTSYPVGQIAISSITVSELQYGVAKSNHPQKSQKRLDAFLRPLVIQTYDEVAARYYGEVRASLEKAGQVIGPLDMLIAAHALALDMVLVTNNTKEFNRVPELEIANWAL